jgi:two-component system CheB/CheR fusion protein
MLEKGYQNLQKTSNQLKASNYQLEKSNFDLMQFASVASHDLKEPLRKIQAFGSLLKEKVKYKLDNKEENYLEKVINAANRMQSLVDDILALSKLSNNGIKQSPVSLTKIVAQITDDLEISIQEKNATITTDPLSTIMAVPGQMHQLFLNLIANGLKFNEASTPVIYIAEKPVSKENASFFNLKNP